MIIADTSIWIEFLKKNEIYFQYFKKLLENQKILGINIVFGELLQGAKSQKEIEIIKMYWSFIPKVINKDIEIESGIYSSKNNLINKGVGLVDSIIIVSAIKTKSKIWTLDKKLLKVIDEDLSYRFN